MFLSPGLCASLLFLRFNLESLCLLTLCVCKFVCALFVYVISVIILTYGFCCSGCRYLPPSRLLSERGGRRRGGRVGWGGDVSPCPWVQHGALHPWAAIPPSASRGASKPQKKIKTIRSKAGRREVSDPNCKTNCSRFEKDKKGSKWRFIGR